MAEFGKVLGKIVKTVHHTGRTVQHGFNAADHLRAATAEEIPSEQIQDHLVGTVKEGFAAASAVVNLLGVFRRTQPAESAEQPELPEN